MTPQSRGCVSNNELMNYAFWRNQDNSKLDGRRFSSSIEGVQHSDVMCRLERHPDRITRHPYYKLQKTTLYAPLYAPPYAPLRSTSGRGSGNLIKCAPMEFQLNFVGSACRVALVTLSCFVMRAAPFATRARESSIEMESDRHERLSEPGDEERIELEESRRITSNNVLPGAARPLGRSLNTYANTTAPVADTSHTLIHRSSLFGLPDPSVGSPQLG
jgi:hypothetical protein